MVAFTRRAMLTATSVPLAAIATRGLAAIPLAPMQGPGAYRMRLGGYQLTALYDGLWRVPIDDHFIRNATRADVNEALAAGFLAPDVLPVSFTALLVNTGKKLILIDTGTAGQITDSAGSLIGNLAAAGVASAQIDTILISHFHPDHIDGLRGKDGERTFPNAEILVPEPEWTFWMDEANLRGASGTVKRYFLNARRIFADIAKLSKM
jgi:glyoxylase-like metal-dependent hydrolase (beta-lactamase superfamily II)